MSDDRLEAQTEQCDCSPYFECNCNPTKEVYEDGELRCKNCWGTLQEVCENHRWIYEENT